MKKNLLISLIFLISFNTIWANEIVLEIENEKISFQTFLEDFKFFIQSQQAPEEVENIFKQSELRKQYFYTNFLVRNIINRYAKNEYLKQRKQLGEAINRIVNLTAISNYIQYNYIGRFVKKPTEEQLKQLHKEMIERNVLSAEYKTKPYNEVKDTVNEFYFRQHRQVLLMQFIGKVQQENRIIYNDDLEDNLLQKYVEDQFTFEQIKTGGNKFWAMKFNNKIILLQTIENDITLFMLVNNSESEIEKYKNDKAYRKQIRTLFLENFTNIYLLNFFAEEKGHTNDNETKKMINFFFDVQLAQTYVAYSFKGKAKEPTDDQIKEFYNKNKEAMFKNVKITEAKDYIVNRIKFQQLQQYQSSLYERLKNRYRFSIKDELIK